MSEPEKDTPLVYMPEETTPTIATEGNTCAIAYLELLGDDTTHYYGRLFAAAPELLEALRELTNPTFLPIGEGGSIGDQHKSKHQQARAAIAKATGGEA